MSRLEYVNSTDIADAIRLGCRTMQNIFNADDDNVPFFSSTVRPKAALNFSQTHSEAHVPGRHLNALLSAEAAVGVKLDEEAVRNHPTVGRSRYLSIDRHSKVFRSDSARTTFEKASMPSTRW
jgi:hypothetical protein